MNLILDTYVIVDNKLLGKVETQTNLGYIIKLDHTEYVDNKLKLIQPQNYKGKILLFFGEVSEKIKPININGLWEYIGYLENNLNYNMVNTILEQNLLQLKQPPKMQTGGSVQIIPNILEKDIQQRYRNENKNEINYLKDMTTIIDNLFIDKQDYKEDIDPDIEHIKSDSIDNSDQVFEKLRGLLEKYKDFDKKLLFDFEQSIIFKEPLTDNDKIIFGKEFISRIKTILNATIKNLIDDNGNQIADIANFFGYLTFSISNGYIIFHDTIIEKTPNIINNDLIKLSILIDQYNKEINHKHLLELIFANMKTSTQNSEQIIKEAIDILSLESFICLQPQPLYIYPVLIKLLFAWLANKKLSESIYKIYLSINLFHSRPDKQYTEDTGIQPIILIQPRYGNTIFDTTLGEITKYFAPYIKYGYRQKVLINGKYKFIKSKPIGFERQTDLVYCAKGSLDLKILINFMRQRNISIDGLLTGDLTGFVNADGNITTIFKEPLLQK